MKKTYLLASDFDQTLSFNDTGYVLCDLLGIANFEEKVAGLSRINLVQSGGELTYLLRHDPEFRRVRKEHLIEVGKRIRLKANIPLLYQLLEEGIEGYRFAFYVISASPEEVVQSALEGILPPERIFGTRLEYHPISGEIEAIHRVAAGYGKVAVLDELLAGLQVSPQRTIYVGDGSSDIHVMLHVNRRDGLTIAVSEARHIAHIAKRTILSEDALSVLIPILEEIAGWDGVHIRALLESHGLRIQEWNKVRTDWLTLQEEQADAGDQAAALLALAIDTLAGTAEPAEFALA
jgi:phosphoserine phosphatase